MDEDRRGDELHALRMRVTELEHALAESRAAAEAQFVTMFETVADGIFISDLSGGIRQVNRAGWTMMGCSSAADLIGRNGLGFIVPEERERAREDFTRVLTEARVFRAEHMAKPVTGAPFPVEINGGLICDPGGNPVGVVGIMKDLGERRELEEGRQRAAKLESVGVLAGGIAHDFNNLLLSVGASLSLAAREITDPEVQRRLDTALQGIRRAGKLTNQLLVFSKGGEPVKRTVVLRDLLHECATFTVQDPLSSAEVRAAPDLWPVLCDSGQIWQVVHNLLLNGIQAMPDGGRIDLVAENVELVDGGVSGLDGGSYVRISVIDEGEGIPSEHLSRIFDPYFTTRPGGTGLGLAASYSIIRRHGGAVGVEDTGPGGTTIQVHLPASRDWETSEEGAHLQGREIHRGTVLLMDDDEAVSEAVRDMLDVLGFTCRVVHDGAEAVAAYHRRMDLGRPYDAVIMDLTVPGGMGGLEAVKQVLKLDPEARVLVSSGYSNDPVMAHPRVHGFRGVLAKPYQIEDLDLALSEVLEESNSV
ncbi:MAG: ATP-binding protein [Pseudomonadota bacterium]